jgi:hypothetical protein
MDTRESQDVNEHTLTYRERYCWARGLGIVTFRWGNVTNRAGANTQMETQPMTSTSTSTSTMTIAEIYDLCDERGVSPTDFWAHAMGGDRAALPREDVERCMREIERHVREEEV